MKTYIEVNSKLKQIHTTAAMAAKVHFVGAGRPADGAETRVWGGSAYPGQTEAMRRAVLGAQYFTHEKGRRNRSLYNLSGLVTVPSRESGPKWSIYLR